MTWLESAKRPVFFHAHPDDETLATGGLIAAFSDAGAAVAVVTATRGEAGEATGQVAQELAGTPDPKAALAALRESELLSALAELGDVTQAFLGWPPARAAGRPARVYGDSGMSWISDGVAGPDPAAEDTAFSLAPHAEPVADLAAFLSVFRADALIGYDEYGGYLHPDHVTCHEVAKQAAKAAGIPRWEIVSREYLGANRLPTGAVTVGFERYRPRICAALRCYRSQLSLNGETIAHVGGQLQRLPLSVTMKLPSADSA
ncbi:MAG: PIG-L family deacetylase [Propionibacteriaceae bacterium]|jgi:N-acetyl-1-D-myo-inositol-2-amino-2-deoxy-alpha-D-glucopyranoside deacetylase|nr:PIG-L family deacetylase [Propionibacteriaceae bacterium]